MTVIAPCPISTCDWVLEQDDELNARNVAVSPQVAAALGTPLDAFLSIRTNQLLQQNERALEEHFATHSVLEWVTDLMEARRLLSVAEAGAELASVVSDAMAATPTLAHSIEVDWDAQLVTVEGRPVPWFLAEAGPRVEEAEIGGDPFALVWLPVLAEEVTVIGEAPANVSRETSPHAHAVSWVDPLLLQLGQEVLAYADPLGPGDGPVAAGKFVHVIAEGSLDRDALVVLDDNGAVEQLLIRGHHFALGKA